MTGFRLGETQRRDIFKAIRLKDGVNPDEVIDALADAAERCRQLREREKAMPSMTEVHKDLRRLIEAHNKMDLFVREMVDHALVEHDVTLDDVRLAAERVGKEPRYRLPAGKGHKTANLSAESFVRECRRIWIDHSSRPLPRRVSETSPFCRFCYEAMPEELRTRRDAGVSGIVNRVLDSTKVRRRRRWLKGERRSL